jgi:signal peptidase II
MKRASKKPVVAWKYLILIVLTVVVISLDQLTKFLILEKFHLGQTSPVICDFFNITYVQNRGAAFGILSQANPAFRVPFFIVVPMVALFSIAYVFKRIPSKDIKLSTSLSLVIAGAVGNLIDRVTLGFVVDFLDFHWRWGYHFPAFNVADSAICIGVGILMLDLVSQDLTQTPKKGSRSNASSVT